MLALDPPATLLLPDRLVTGIDGEVWPGWAVVVHAGKIVWTGPRDAAPDTASGMRIIDLAGATLLPGLIEAHTHLALDGGHDPMNRVQRATDAQIRQQISDAALKLVSVGVTTARDLGAPRFLELAVRSAIAGGDLPGPRLLLATRPVTRPGSHCWFLGGASANAVELATAITENYRRGADWVKVMVTGGFTSGDASPYVSQFSPDELRLVVEFAHALDLPVSAHAHGTAGIRAAVEAGVDMIEHCTWFTPDGFDVATDLLATIADYHIPVCPTVNARARQAGGRLAWVDRAGHLQAMRAAGIRFAVGTDSGIAHSPHAEYADALVCYTDLGMSPLDVLQLATSGSAKALRLDGVTGSVRVGLDADLLAVDGDPTTDLRALRKIRFVMVRGRTVVDSAHPPTVTRQPATGGKA